MDGVTFPETVLALSGKWLLTSMTFGTTKKPPNWVLEFNGGADFKVTNIGGTNEKPGQERIHGVIHAWDPPGPNTKRARVITIEFHKALNTVARGLTVCAGTQQLPANLQQAPTSFAGFWQDTGGGHGTFSLDRMTA